MAAREAWHRCFIALVPDAATRDALAAWPLEAAVRRVSIDQLHLTLAFLGSIPEDKGRLLAAALPSTVVPLPPLRIERLEYWPSRSHPRLAVAAFAGPDSPDSLAELEIRVRTLVCGLGLPIDDHRPFRPHVTLARLPRDARPIASKTRCADSLEPRDEVAGEASTPARFDTLTLYSSTLARHGAQYRALASAPVPRCCALQ